tara:strand:- start:7842 stop:13622 length:5781 start_codon:yes stop_codon:yes gene_type:complete
MDAFTENLQSARKYNNVITTMLQNELDIPHGVGSPGRAPDLSSRKNANNTELLRDVTGSSGLRPRYSSELNVARPGISSQKANILEDEIERLQRDVERHREVEAELEAAMSAAAEAWLRDTAKKSAEPDKQVEVEDARLTAAMEASAHLKDNLAVEVQFRGLAEEGLAMTRKELDAASNKLVAAAEKGEHLIRRIATLEADLETRNLEADELRAELDVSRNQQASTSAPVMDDSKATAEASGSAELEEALQAKQMADAQTSMLRSCLEDTEELLDESRSKASLLEKKLQALKSETPTGNEDEIERLRNQAAEAESRASAAVQRAKDAEFEANLAKEGAQKMRLAAEAERDSAVSAMEVALEEANKKLHAAEISGASFGDVKDESGSSAAVRVASLTNKLAQLKTNLASAERRVVEKETEVAELRARSGTQAHRNGSVDLNSEASQGESSSEQVDVTAAGNRAEALQEVKSLTRSLQEERAGVKVLVDNAAHAAKHSEAQLKTLNEKLENELRESKRLTAELAASQLRVSHTQSDAQVAARSSAEVESKVAELETSLAAFRLEAAAALQRKTDELIEVSRASAEIEASKQVADGEIQRLNEALLEQKKMLSDESSSSSSEVMKLRESLAESEASRQSLRLVETDMKMKLENAETSTVEREAEYAAKHEQLTVKLVKSEESLQAACAETAKMEWSVSELKSQLQIDESRALSKQAEIDKLNSSLSKSRTKASDERASALQEFSDKQAASDAKFVISEQECADLRGELAVAQLSVEQFSDAADSAKRRVDQLSSNSTSMSQKIVELESRCNEAEDRASKAERALSAFKEESRITLKLKSEELVVASYAISQAEDAKAEIEDKLKSLKVIVSRDERHAADETLRQQVVELREALSEALDAQAGQQSTQTEFRLLLEATEAATADRESEFELQCKRFQDQLESAELRAQEHLVDNAKMEWAMSILETRVQTELSRASAKQDEIDGLLKQVQELNLQVETTRAGADERVSACESETFELRELLESSRRELQAAQEASAQLAGELTSASLQREESAKTVARLTSEVESKRTIAEGQVTEVEAALSAFRIEANDTLESKTAEVLSATLAAADAQTAKKSADAEVQQLKGVVQKYEEDKCLDSAIKAEVTELHDALRDALDAQKGQQSSLTELKLRLEATETSTAEREAEYAAKYEQLTVKLAKSEESLQAAHAETAKMEWSVSELKSRLLVETTKLKDAQDRGSSSSTKLLEAEQEVISTKMELAEAKRLSEHSVVDLENVRRRLETHVASAVQLESKCADAEQRASNAEVALLAFKRETMLLVEKQIEDITAAKHSNAELMHADFQKTATVALESKTAELALATRAAAVADSASGSSIGNIDRVKQMLAKVAENAASAAELRVSAVRREFATEIDRLRELLAEATDSRALEVEISSLRAELERAREAHVLQTALHDDLRAQLDGIQGLYEAHESTAREETSILRDRLEEKDRTLLESRHKRVAADAEISRLEAKCKELEIVNEAASGALTAVSSETQIFMTAHINRATEATERATQMASSTAAAHAEVALLKTRCVELERLLESEQTLFAADKETLAQALAEQTVLAMSASDRASLLEASKNSMDSELRRVKVRCAELEQAYDCDEVQRLVTEIQNLQRDHAESVFETLKEQLKLVAAAAEKSNDLNKRHVYESQAAMRLAESEHDVSRNQSALLAEEISIARANVAALSAVRDSLETELAAKEDIVVNANNARDQAIDEAQDLRLQLADLQRDTHKLEMDAITKLEELSGEAQVSAVSSEELQTELVEIKSRAESAARDAKLARTELEAKLRASSAEREAARTEVQRLSTELERYAAGRAGNVERAKEELREETELMMRGAQEEVTKALMESERLKRRLRASGARVAQLINEIIRLQKHEHALHAILGAAEA